MASLSRGTAAIGLLLATAAASPHYDYSDDPPVSGYLEKEDAEAHAICRRVISAEPPARDYPTPAQTRALKGCNSEALYYGIKRPADPVKARHCALVQRNPDNNPDYGEYFSGSGILAMVYANGRGVPKNLAIATHMACSVEDATAATIGRVRHLDGLRRKAEKTPFDICDDATSGASGGNCAEHESKLAGQNRDRRIAVLSRGWSATQRALFLKAYRSMTAYADLVHEMDCYGGTAELGCQIGGSEEDVERFLGWIETLAHGREPAPRKPPSDPLEQEPDASDPYADMPPDTRKVYETNDRKRDAAKAQFETDLLAFARVAFPKLSPQRVKAIFADVSHEGGE